MVLVAPTGATAAVYLSFLYWISQRIEWAVWSWRFSQVSAPLQPCSHEASEPPAAGRQALNPNLRLTLCVCVCVFVRGKVRERERGRGSESDRERERERERERRGWHPRMTDGFSWKKGGGGMLTRHFRICTCSTFRKKHTCKYRGSGRWIYVCACVRACMCVCRAFFIRTGESCNYHWVLLCTHKAQATQGTLHIHKHTHIVPSHSVQPSWKVPFLPEHQSDHVTMPARLVNRPRLANGYQHPQPHTPHRPTHLLLKVT